MRPLIPAALVVAAVFVVMPRTGSAQQAWGLAVDDRGRVFLAEDVSSRGRIWRVDPDGTKALLAEGKFFRDVRLDDKGSPLTIRVDEDFRTGALVNLDRPGKPVSLTTPATGPGRSFWGQFVATRDGTIYHGGDQQILVSDARGRSRPLAGGMHGTEDGEGDNARFQSIAGMALGPDGTLYVTDHRTIRKITPRGVVTTLTNKLLGPFPGDPSPSHPPSGRGLALAEDGSLYVAVDAFLRISKVTQDGEITTAARTEGKWQPQGIAVHRGAIYITETMFNGFSTEGPRLRVFDPDGTSRILADFAGDRVKPLIRP